MDFFLICSEVSKSDFLLMSFSSYLDCQVDLNKQLLHLNLLRRAALALVDIFSSWATVSKDLQKCLAHTSGEEPQDKPLLCHLQPSFLCVLFYFVFCFCFVLVLLFCFPVVLLCSPHSCKITDCRSLHKLKSCGLAWGPLITAWVNFLHHLAQDVTQPQRAEGRKNGKAVRKTNDLRPVFSESTVWQGKSFFGHTHTYSEYHSIAQFCREAKMQSW